MNASTTVLILVSSANLIATVILAKAAIDAKRQAEQIVNEAKNTVSRAVFKLQSALDELDLWEKA